MNWGKSGNWGKHEIGLRLCEIWTLWHPLILELWYRHEKWNNWINFGNMPNMPKLPNVLNWMLVSRIMNPTMNMINGINVRHCLHENWTNYQMCLICVMKSRLWKWIVYMEIMSYEHWNGYRKHNDMWTRDNWDEFRDYDILTWIGRC